MLRTLAVTLFVLGAATACKQDKKTEPAGEPATKPTADKPAAPAADKPAEPAKPAAFEPTWEKYESKDGGFTIELPSKPEEKDQGGMKIVGAEFGTTAADDRTAMCGVAYMSLGDVKADPKVMLDGATARHKQNAKVIEEKDVTLGKYPGRSLVVENDSHRKWMRVYIVDKTIYVLNCGGPFDRAATDGPIATKALDSFALTK